MSPLSKKRGHHDLRILRFERTASTAAVRTRGDFGIIPSPLLMLDKEVKEVYKILPFPVRLTAGRVGL